MLSIFVFHAVDRVGAALAALLRACDTNGRFQYLPIESAESRERLERFTAHHRLSPAPFIVLTPEDGGSRSVLHGDSLQNWLSNFVDAFLAEAGPCLADRIRRDILEPYLGPHICRLAAYAYATTPTTPMEVEHPEPKIVEIQDTVDIQTLDDEEDDDGTTMATMPAKQTTKKISVAGIMGEAKAREKMVQPRVR